VAGYISLTFDDGPMPVTTPQILATLKARGVKATFFVVGRNIEAWPQGIQLEKADGHKVGNHTFDHPYLTQLSSTQVSTELSRTSGLIQQYTGSHPTEWRPPYGDWNASVRQIATNQGMSMNLWDDATDSNDWDGASAQLITDRVLAGAFDGATVLMHDWVQNTATALPGLLDGLTSRGYCFH
jgi:peptidoglycan/xylan/chitin deacetylase (PgdA/CDA1 family)